MIKINLGKTRLESIEAMETSESVSSNSNIREVGVKILVLFLGVGALMFYEGQNLDKINASLARSNSELMQIQAELQTKTEELAGMASIESDAKALEDKLSLLKRLSRLRLREVKSLDYIQSIVPQRIWLVGLEMQGESLTIIGRGSNEEDVSMFVKRLEAGGYFSDVILIKDSTLVADGQSVREFEISARTEVIN